MRKVIVKCKVHDRERFEKKLEDVGLEFSPVYWQYDRVYVPRGYKGRSNFPRLIMRTEMHAIDDPPAYLLSLRRHIEDSGVDIIEDTKIVDYEGMVSTILQLGFKQFGEVSRHRQEITMTKNTMLYLDTLDEDNSIYAKIESILEDKEPAMKAKLELVNTLRSFGETDVIESTYFEL
jgi:adenylate cyclase class IV